MLSSVQFSSSVGSDSLQPHELQHARPPCPSPAPGVYSNSRPLSRRCHPTIHPLSAPSPTFNLSQHQRLFQSQVFASVCAGHWLTHRRAWLNPSIPCAETPAEMSCGEVGNGSRPTAGTVGLTGSPGLAPDSQLSLVSSGRWRPVVLISVVDQKVLRRTLRSSWTHILIRQGSCPRK